LFSLEGNGFGIDAGFEGGEDAVTNFASNEEFDINKP